MSYLRCNVRSCSNNQNELCILEGIKVDGSRADNKADTQCSSFTQRAENYSNVISRHTAAEPETDIRCDAVNCSYNKDFKCAAPSVDISGSHAAKAHDTQCSTFDCKKTL